MEKIQFKNLVEILKFYFENIYKKPSVVELKEYKINYLKSEINLLIPEFLCKYISKNKSRLIKNTINSSYIYCFKCDSSDKIEDIDELVTLNKVHSIYDIIKETYEDIIDPSVMYIALCNSCTNGSDSNCSFSSNNDSLDDYETDSDI